jgi:hypothetical protein
MFLHKNLKIMSYFTSPQIPDTQALLESVSELAPFCVFFVFPLPAIDQLGMERVHHSAFISLGRNSRWPFSAWTFKSPKKSFKVIKHTPE